MNKEQQVDVDRAIRIMADEAEKLNADSNDENQIIRQIVLRRGLGFNAWFCVCCEIADRQARKEGFKSSIDRAAKAASAAFKTMKEKKNGHQDCHAGKV